MECICGANVNANVGDSLHNGKLKWYLSYNCVLCGNAVECDGIDSLPQDIKDAIIAQDGKYALILHNIKELSKAVYILKKQFAHDFERPNHLQTDSIIELTDGTKNEIYFIYGILTKMGIKNIEIKKSAQ